jgi:hypothetical protein
VQVNGITLYPNVVYKDTVGFAPDLILIEQQDNSIWNVHSYAKFYPSHNFSAALPLVQVTITLEREPQQINFLLLVPVVSLYCLVGFSVLLRGPKELANRLLVYLTVFLFAYGFPSNVRALPMTPVVTGFSMIELVALALIPITVILAVFSILIRAFINTPYDLSNHSGLVGFASSTALDTIAIEISEIALFVIARITVVYRFGLPSSVTYTLADLNGWGYAPAILLCLGLVISIALAAFRIRRA